MAIGESALIGCLLGVAVGDALGLPYEGLSRRRATRLFREPDRHRLLPGRGMVSDDTEHACVTMQALIASGDDVDAFLRELAGRLRFWLLGVPAGTGLATLKASVKLMAEKRGRRRKGDGGEKGTGVIFARGPVCAERRVLSSGARAMATPPHAPRLRPVRRVSIAPD